MKPNFKNIDIKATAQQENTAEWVAKTKSKRTGKTPEQIPVKPVYTKEDLEGMEHLNYAAGVAPFLRTRMLLCTLCNLGQSVNTPVFQLLKNQTRFTAAIWPPDKRFVGCIRPCNPPRI